VSVSDTLVLPSQPTTGSVTIRPLGGNGYTSPQSYYLVDFRLDADGSGGTITLNVALDPQFQNVVSLAEASLIGAAASRVVRLDIFEATSALRFSVQGTMLRNADTGTHMLYAPAAVFDVGQFEAVVDNVDTEEFRLKLLIYNFKRDAFNRVPLNVLLASLPRGFDIQ